MPFVRIKTINGKRYASLEERYRENGKVKSRYLGSLGPVGGGKGGAVPNDVMRKAAQEVYRDVLRENVSLFGRGHPGARYAREQQAREAFLRYLDSEQRGKPELPLTEQEQHEKNIADYEKGRSRSSPFEVRASSYAVSHPSPGARAKEEYMDNRAEVRAEDARLDAEEAAQPTKGSPTDEEEAMHAQWSDNQAAQFDEDQEEYTAWANDQDAKAAPEGDEATETGAADPSQDGDEPQG